MKSPSYLMGVDSINNSNSELIFTLFIIGVLLIICIIAVVIFFRVWRRENKGRGRNFFE